MLVEPEAEFALAKIIKRCPFEHDRVFLRTTFDVMQAEIDRLSKIETAARALKFSAYPAHGSGFVLQVTGGNINDLEAALGVSEQKTTEK